MQFRPLTRKSPQSYRHIVDMFLNPEGLMMKNILSAALVAIIASASVVVAEGQGEARSAAGGNNANTASGDHAAGKGGRG